jgi:hypothetical protein
VVAGGWGSWRGGIIAGAEPGLGLSCMMQEGNAGVAAGCRSSGCCVIDIFVNVLKKLLLMLRYDSKQSE